MRVALLTNDFFSWSIWETTNEIFVDEFDDGCALGSGLDDDRRTGGDV
jgi:hypothetical protein